MPPLQLVTLAPGHFHAALIQKEMLPGVDARTHVFAPLDDDLLAHLGRIAAFNRRPTNPTAWRLDVRAGDDWLERFDAERPGDIVVVSGRNRRKIDLIERAVAAGKHVLADKPWIIDAANLPRLIAVLDTAARTGVVVYDIMTERYEITARLQRELVNDRELFGEIEPGQPENPGVSLRSVHYLKKQVAGVPLRRPGWFFDITEQGEALADVGTHLVDQVSWILAADRPIDFTHDVQMVDARRWPTVLDRAQFAAITGLELFPSELAGWVDGGRLRYFCNNQVTYRLRGICIRLDIEWQDETPPGGGDTYDAVFRGSRSSSIIRQVPGKQPEVFVAPNPMVVGDVRRRLDRLVEKWQIPFPGVRFVEAGTEFHIAIPDAFRTGHEAHFAEVAVQFTRYLAAPATLPAWEASHLAAKYHVTTRGVAMGG